MCPLTSVECLGPLAQGLPLFCIVTAQYGGTALLQTPYLGQRPQEHLPVPGVARDNVPVERGAEADRIRGKQELAATVKRNERARALEIASLETQIATLEGERAGIVAAITAASEQGAVEALRELGERFEKVEAELLRLMDAWAELAG